MPCNEFCGLGHHAMWAHVTAVPMPALQGQHAAYIERQLAAFAQGMRQNDINQQMRTIAKQLTPAEIRFVGTARTAKRRQIVDSDRSSANPSAKKYSRTSRDPLRDRARNGRWTVCRSRTTLQRLRQPGDRSSKAPRCGFRSNSVTAVV
jgi:hypothetical protein